MWLWGTPFNKTMIRTKRYCFEVCISFRVSVWIDFICFVHSPDVNSSLCLGMLIRQKPKKWSGLAIFTDSQRLAIICKSGVPRELVRVPHDWEENVMIKTTSVIMDCNFYMAMASYPSSKISSFHLHLWWKPHFSLPSDDKYEKKRYGNTRPNHYKKLKFWIVFGIFRDARYL